MIRLILFDLGGVVFTNGTRKFVETLSGRYSLHTDDIRAVLDGDMGTRYREGTLTRDQFWYFVREKLSLTESADQLESEWISFYSVIQETKHIIETLRTKYRVMYLSDNVKERVAALNRTYHFLSWFDGGIFSHDVGVRKPHPRVYEMALEAGNAKPEETVFIDDKPQALEPAERLGIHTILFESPEQLQRVLDERGL